MASRQNQIVELATSPLAKVIGTVFLAGVAWARFEYKVDEKFNSLIKNVEVHMAIDFEEKKRFNEQISELRNEVNKMKEQAEDFVRNEYVRPEEPRPQTERRRR